MSFKSPSLSMQSNNNPLFSFKDLHQSGDSVVESVYPHLVLFKNFFCYNQKSFICFFKYFELSFIEPYNQYLKEDKPFINIWNIFPEAFSNQYMKESFCVVLKVGSFIGSSTVISVRLKFDSSMGLFIEVEWSSLVGPKVGLAESSWFGINIDSFHQTAIYLI